jgi:hypothetical protein
LFLSSHPEGNGEPSLWELKFDVRTAVERMSSIDLPFLTIQRMERIVHRNFARIAGIIPEGWNA